MSTTNSEQKITDIRSSVSGNNNYIYNLEMREHMFDKVLTPTDVGKQRRILIPRQHVEAYFPLEDGQEKELEFTDRNGKMWTFRYFKSNLSYVMSWRIFLKEKKLVAGDTVSFYRAYIPDNNAAERQRKILLIDWSYGRFSPFYRSQFQGREDLGLGVIEESNNVESLLDDIHHGRSEPLVHPSEPSQPSKKIRLFGVNIEESSSGETSWEMGVIGCTSLSPAVIRDDGQSSQRSPSGEMGASSSSFNQLNDDEDRKKKGKCLAF